MSKPMVNVCFLESGSLMIYTTNGEISPKGFVEPLEGPLGKIIVDPLTAKQLGQRLMMMGMIGLAFGVPIPEYIQKMSHEKALSFAMEILKRRNDEEKKDGQA